MNTVAIFYSVKPFTAKLKGEPTRHPKCKGYKTEDIGWGSDYDCGYMTKIDCDECKYGGGRKDPAAKCNWL